MHIKMKQRKKKNSFFYSKILLRILNRKLHYKIKKEKNTFKKNDCL